MPRRAEQVRINIPKAREYLEGPAAAVSSSRGGDACQLPTLQLTFEFALDGLCLERGLANRLAYRIRGADALRSRIKG